MYLVVAVVGYATLESVDGSLLFRAAMADFAMTVVVYVFSVWKSNSSAYDMYWSIVPSYLSIWLFFVHDGTDWNWMQWGTMIVLNLWSWRLTHNWARGWPGWHHEDWRYLDFRNAQGKWFQFTNFFGIHVFPTVMVFLACLGVFEVAGATQFNTGLMAAGIGVGLLGVALELVADNQLRDFRRRPNPGPEDILDSGLWGVVRYPNYLGEMLFWWSMALCGLGAGGSWVVCLGAVAMMLMFVLASIPMKEKRMLARRPDYPAYQQRVPLLIPRLW